MFCTDRRATPQASDSARDWMAMILGAADLPACNGGREHQRPRDPQQRVRSARCCSTSDEPAQAGKPTVPYRYGYWRSAELVAVYSYFDCLVIPVFPLLCAELRVLFA